MDSAQRTRFELNAVSHPGETVVEYLEFNDWSQRDLARRTGLTPKTISEICNGKAPITPPTALDLTPAMAGDLAYFIVAIVLVSAVESLLCSRMADRLAAGSAEPGAKRGTVAALPIARVAVAVTISAKTGAGRTAVVAVSSS